MPPWLPSDESYDFLNDGVTDDELAILAEWAAAVVVSMSPPTRRLSRRAAPQFDPTRHRDEPGEPTSVRSKKDDYRCQVYEVPDPEGDGTWITGMSFEPDGECRASCDHQSCAGVGAARDRGPFDRGRQTRLRCSSARA